MKKNILNIAIVAALLCTIISSSARAQDVLSSQAQSATKFMIGITGGVSAPMGNFMKTDYANDASGYAGTGYNMGIIGTYFINKHWGIAELFSFQQFSYVGGQNLTFGMQKSFDVDSVTFSVRGDNHTYSFLVGPVYTMALGDKLNVDLRLLGGFVNANLAGNNVTLTDGGVTDPTFYQAVSRANTFGMQLGAALRYRVTDHIGIMANVDYFYSKPDFVVNNINRNNLAGRDITSYNQPIEGINANLSVVYMLNHK